MKKNKILAGISALVMGATMMAGTAMSASADSCCIYPCALKNNSTTELSMMQKAFTGGASSYDATNETLTIPVQSFSHSVLFVSGNGYLTSLVLYLDDDGTTGYSSGDTIISTGTVSPSLANTSPSTLTFTGLDADEYALIQDSIVDAYVSYDLEILSGSYIHNHNEADFTLTCSPLTYPNTSVDLGGKTHA